MKLYLKYLGMLFRAQLAYRTSFVLLSIGQFFIPFTVFISFTMLFERFGTIKGYSFYEMALCYGVIHCSFSLAEAFFRGFDSFSGLIREAEFDRLLLRPQNLVIQVLGTQFEFTRIGRLAQSVVVLVIAISGLNIHWGLWKVILLICMVWSGMAIFAGVYLLAATLCFWTVQSTEIANIFTDGGREMGQFPLSIYQKSFRQFFTFVVPFGMTNYYPLLMVLDRVDFNWLYAIAPLYAFVFMAVALKIWYKGVGKYQSAGS